MTVAQIILTDLWDLRLARANFRDLEVRGQGASLRRCSMLASDPMSRARPGCRGMDRGAYYEQLQRERWRFEDLDPTDREIAWMLAEGSSVREVKTSLRVGQYRIQLVLSEMLNERKKPWHWRKGGMGKTKTIPRAELHLRRASSQRHGSTRP